MKLRIYMRDFGVTVLGPGKRYCLWVQGCNKRCEGCTTPESRSLDGGSEMSVNAIAWEIIISDAEGITISGGEPFLQAEELARMIQIVRSKKDLGVIVYTGYIYEELIEREDARLFLNQIDLLIDGPYIKELDDGKSLRGSSNQRIILLTDRYKNSLDEYGADGRKTQVIQHGFQIHKIGVANHLK